MIPIFLKKKEKEANSIFVQNHLVSQRQQIRVKEEVFIEVFRSANVRLMCEALSKFSYKYFNLETLKTVLLIDSKVFAKG